MTDRAYFILAIISLVGFGFAAGVLFQRIADEGSPSPCREDEALIWLDAPDTVSCVPIDSLPGSPETGRR